MKWIFGNFRTDFFWLCLPGLVGVVIGHGLTPVKGSFGFLLFAFFAKGFLDSGHVYTTLWRTFFHRPERSRLSVYWILPPILFLIFTTWIYFGGVFLAAFVIYSTTFHNIRQFYGISRWYQKLNGRMNIISDYFLYSNCLLPFIVFHFMHLNTSDYLYYSGEAQVFYPDFWWEFFFSWVYAFNLMAWAGFEIFAARKGIQWNRVLSVATPSLIYGTSFLLPSSEASTIFPLVMSHGASYFALNSLAMNKTQPRFPTLKSALLVVAITALIFGTLEFILDDAVTNITKPENALLGGLFLTPAFCHYIFDMWLWKKSHPESRLVYS